MASLPAHYNDTNRAFLQAFMVHGALTFEQARPILAQILSVQTSLAEGADADEAQATTTTTDDDIDEHTFESYIAAAQDALSPFDYQVRSAVHQVTRERVFAIINTTSDPATTLATTYTADEMSFVRRLLDSIFDEHNTPRQEVMCLTSMQATKLGRPKSRAQQQQRRTSNGDEIDDGNDEGDASVQLAQQAADKGLKHSEVEHMMDSLVDQGWLEMSGRKFYGLSPRALLELRAWLVETYNDPDAEPNQWQRIKLCEACRDIITVGQRCENRECTVRLHDICGDAFWRTRREKACPRCATRWDGNAHVGEKVVTMSKVGGGGGRRSQGSRRSEVEGDTTQQVDDESDDGDG